MAYKISSPIAEIRIEGRLLQKWIMPSEIVTKGLIQSGDCVYAYYKNNEYAPLESAR
jgi:hypothetical protein